MNLASKPTDWHVVENVHEIESPALLVYPERIEENIRRMIRLAGNPDWLRPHLKTVKMPEVVVMLLEHGIRRFKCATIAEAEMAADAGAPDVLLANQPVGPNVGRLCALVRRYPRTRFSTIVDDASVGKALSAVFAADGKKLEVWLDIDCGMHRTGMPPGPGAIEFYRWLSSLPGLVAAGLHVYDGHIHESDPAERARQCEAEFAPVAVLRGELERDTKGSVRVIAGGTPTFPIHARRADVECSPGTCLLWDFGYADRFPDLDFLQAALVLTRVVSMPAPDRMRLDLVHKAIQEPLVLTRVASVPAQDRLCLDLGHKAIAAENPHPRVRFDLPDAAPVMHSEEHLVISTAHAAAYAVGNALFGIPRHICPTVALYAEAVVIRGGRAVERWKITARDRRLTI
jgi:D-serine deaminase-like pyridoxal phosphate-dependent protein